MRIAFIPLAFACALLTLSIGGGCSTADRGGRTAGEYFDDTTLASRVRTALADSAEYKFPDVNVTAFRGTVQLSGFAVSDAQKQRASDIAKTVPGVRNVENKITVRPNP